MGFHSTPLQWALPEQPALLAFSHGDVLVVLNPTGTDIHLDEAVRVARRAVVAGRPRRPARHPGRHLRVARTLMSTLELRFRVTSPELLALPWPEPLGTWDATTIAIRDLPVGPSRHLVRFVEADGRLWAVKELPHDVALQRVEALRSAEDHALPAVRPAGIVVQPREDTALLVTHYLEGSWQYRRLLMRVPSTMTKHRTRLLAGISRLLVDVHRHGLFWGDCSLANTLFTRDGQEIKASLVDAETAELHDRLSDGQRAYDLQLAVENILGGLIDVARATRRAGRRPGPTCR